MMGQEGSGKGMTVDPIKRILGERNWFQPSKCTEVIGQWNKSVMGKKLLYLNEMTWGGDKAAAGDIKKLITEEKISIREKYITDFSVDNLANYIIDGNDDWVIPAGSKTRRWAVYKTSNYMAGVNLNKKQLAEIDEITSVDILRLARTLRDWDTSKWNDRQPPTSQALFTQQLKTIPDYEKWWFNALECGCIHGYEFGSKVKKSELYDMYKEHTQSKHPLGTIRELFTKLSEISNTDMQKTYSQRCGVGVERVIKIPSLKDAREGFAEYMGANIPWHDGDDEAKEE